MKRAFSTLLGSSLLAASIAIASTATSVQAFVLTGKLTGDIRPDNPDNLIVDVTIKTGADAGLSLNQALWTVDINSPLHPDIKLDEFYFNLANSISTGDVSFSGFNPNGWAISSPATTQGAGGVATGEFRFEALDPAGPPNADDVTNSQNLSFIMTYAGGDLTENHFLLAPTATSNDAGSGQLGAHLQSLNAAPGESDSGFAFGNYQGSPEEPPSKVPEPAALAGLGLIAGGLVVSRRRKVSQTA